MKNLYLGIIAILATTQVLAENIQPRIVGGTVTSVAEFPSFVTILADGSYCGGSVIDSKWILTAAHCIYDTDDKLVPASNVQVGLNPRGITDNTIIAKPVAVKRIIPHPQYNSATLVNDIALIELSATTSVPRGQLYAGVDSLVSELSTAVGLGSTTQQEPDERDTAINISPSTLLKVDLPITSNAQCESQFGSFPENHLCAGFTTKGKDTCFGDSGGPLYVNKNNNLVQVGVVSFGSGCGAGILGGYTSVKAYQSFISQYTSASFVGSGTSLPVETTVSNVSGLWYDPVLNGLGFSILQTPEGQLSIYYYGYRAGGNPLWLVSVTPYSASITADKVITLTMNEPTARNNATFFRPPTTASSGTNDWGTIKFTAHSCTSATAVLSGKDGAKTFNLVKLASGAVCSN